MLYFASVGCCFHFIFFVMYTQDNPTPFFIKFKEYQSINWKKKSMARSMAEHKMFESMSFTWYYNFDR